VREGRWLVAVDVGGTYTDALAVSATGAVVTAKVPSTPDDPAEAFASALRSLESRGLVLGAIDLVFHGTTVATNATLTDQLARVVLVTTEGFADVLGYRNGTRPSVYDLQQPRPVELVRRRDRVEARERLSSRGEVLTPLTDTEVARVVEVVAAAQPEAVAVSFLFSYLDDHHERRMAEALAQRLPGVPVARSAAVAREFREYPRTATAAVNAGLRPVVGRYLVSTGERLARMGVTGRLMIMQSNGGCVPAPRADEEAHRLLLSGPAAGVAGTVALGREYGIDRLVCFDMGGTSLDVCLVNGASPPLTATQTVRSHPILCPSVDMVTIGAGGGSIAHVGPSGRLSVGPRSAGAQPGPAAYGLGGEEATVTDAHVVLGTLPVNLSLAGGLALDPDAARKAVAAVATGLALSVDDAADGIVRVAVSQMSLALRRVSVARGIDPEGYTLVAFGGAGPLHAGLLLRELGFDAILVPRYPGLFAASGLISTDLRIDESKTVLSTLRDETLPGMAAWLEETAGAMRGRLEDDGIAPASVRIVASADCRYVGQGYELGVVLSERTPQALAAVPSAFTDLHRRTYGHHDPDGEVEVVTLRLSAFGPLDRPRMDREPGDGARTAEGAVVDRRPVRMPGSTCAEDVAVYDRSLLAAGHEFVGPAVVHQHDATTLVLKGQRGHIDDKGSMWIRERR
jgi:N-methylhydantoinase A